MRGLSLIAVGLLLIAVVAPLGGASDPQEEAFVVVWTQDASEVEIVGADVLAEYGAFVLARADSAQRAALAQDLIVEVVPTTIEKGTVRFDTSEGDVTLPPGLMAGPDEPYLVVQFKGPIHRDWLAWLHEQGDVLDYVPHNAFVVRTGPGATESLGQHEMVSFTGPFHPAYKLHHALPHAGALTVDLQLWQGGDVQEVIDRVELIGGELTLTGIDGIEPYVRVELDASLVHEVARISDVAWIEPVFEGDPLDNADAAWVTQSGNPENGASGALLDQLVNDLLRGNQQSGRSIHEAGLTGAGQVVAVADGGLDNSGGSFIHEMFSDPDHGPFQFGVVNLDHRKVRAYFALTEDGNMRGDYVGHSHGVHTAGSAGGDAPEDGEYLTYNLHDGQSFAAHLIKMDMARGSSWQLPVDYYNAFHPTYEAGARLHSNSYGYPHDTTYNLRARQNDMYTHEHPDFLIFRSMGNTATNTIRPEAVGKNVVGSGATQNGGQYENMASFSSRGPTADERVKPTFVAPGQNVVSARLGNSYGSASGTSMSTPTSAGAAGLVREYFEAGWYPGGEPGSGDAFNPSSALVRGVLINSAQPINGHGTDRPGLGGDPFGDPSLKPNWPNGDMGWGIVRLHETLTFEGDTHGLFVVDGDSIGTGEELSYTVSVNEPGLGLKVTLAWVDPAATVGASPALVNDLDLTVTTPNGITLPGNVFAGLPAVPLMPPVLQSLFGEVSDELGPFSAPGEPDRRNVEEQVILPVALPGEYTITVTGFNVPTGDQDFALVVSGGI